MSEENASLENQDNLQSGNWFDVLPDDIKSEKTLEKFKSEDGISKLAQSYIGLEKKLGNAVWIPGDDAKPEDVADFRKKLGIPESAEKYDLKYKEHEALKFDENMDKSWKAKAHELGLTPKQAQALTDHYSDLIIGSHEANSKAYEKAVEDMKVEYGNDYQNVLDKANNVLRTFADEKDMESIKPFENDVRLVKLLAKVGDAMSEHTLKKGEGMTPEDTKKAAEEKLFELQKIYMDESKDYSERKRANIEWLSLHEKVHGAKEVSGSNAI